MDKKYSCGYYYKQALAAYTGGNASYTRQFAAGFVFGQAEKVFLGACQGAIFRPSFEWHDMLLKITEHAAEMYGLVVRVYDSEIYIFRPEARPLFEALYETFVDSPQWHLIRAQLTGVPPRDVDIKFHEREGAKERAD